ncbi:hypothetical protein [Pseudomonas sp.]|uniref:hypothetical protein n=1 Tax=Pseudomonas sp. TaxID=306 RepID=UPI002730BBA5|nr:hypothetical protein [Pseudomonas sp.]MDP2245679.1 hypothetical protein [Pseudomonas sp.]
MTPLEKWKKYLSPLNPPRTFSSGDVGFICHATFHSSINNNYVRHLNLRWSGPGLSQVKAELKNGQKAEVLYDMSDLSKVYVSVPGSGIYFPADCSMAFQNGLTMTEYKFIRALMKSERKLFTEENARKALLTMYRSSSEELGRQKERVRQHLRDIKAGLIQSEDSDDVLDDWDESDDTNSPPASETKKSPSENMLPSDEENLSLSNTSSDDSLNDDYKSINMPRSYT